MTTMTFCGLAVNDAGTKPIHGAIPVPSNMTREQAFVSLVRALPMPGLKVAIFIGDRFQPAKEAAA